MFGPFGFAAGAVASAVAGFIVGIIVGKMGMDDGVSFIVGISQCTTPFSKMMGYDPVWDIQKQ